MVTPLRSLFRPINVEVRIAGGGFTNERSCQDVVLQKEQKESGTIGRGLNPRTRILRRESQSVVVRRVNRISRIKLSIDAQEDNVLWWNQLFIESIGDFPVAYRQRHFQCLSAGVVVPRLGGDAKVW